MVEMIITTTEMHKQFLKLQVVSGRFWQVMRGYKVFTSQRFEVFNSSSKPSLKTYKIFKASK